MEDYDNANHTLVMGRFLGAFMGRPIQKEGSAEVHVQRGTEDNLDVLVAV